MMKRTFLIGVAAGALLAGANVMASAQGMNERQQQPSASSGGMERGGASTTQQKGKAGSEMKSDQKGLNSRAQAPEKGMSNEKGMSGQAQQEPKAQDQKAQDQKKSTTGQAQQDQKGQRAQDTQKSGDQKMQRAQDQKGESGKNAQSSQQSGGKAAQGDAKGGNKAANLTTEQKTKIRTTVLRGSNAPRVTNVNFSVSVGTVIPASVHFVALPPVLVEIFPEWSGYDYIIVDERIVILEPQTRKIVTILVV
jgi:type IV secretory pathway VirB10-like protein